LVEKETKNFKEKNIKVEGDAKAKEKKDVEKSGKVEGDAKGKGGIEVDVKEKETKITKKST